MPSLADLIRSYEQLHGGAIPSLHKFHRFLKTHESGPQFEGGGPPPGLGALNLGALNFGALNQPVEGQFGFHRNFQVRAQDFRSPALIARLNAALAGYPQREDLNLPKIGALVACGDYGCVYRANDAALRRLYKVIPQRLPQDAYMQGAYYNQAKFATEAAKTRSLGEARVGPELYHHFSLSVPLLPSERDSFEFDLGGEHMTVYILLLEELHVRVNPGGRSPEKGIDLERDGADVSGRKQELITQAQRVLNCQLDVADVEWGYHGERELGNLRIFDVDCNGPLRAADAAEVGAEAELAEVGARQQTTPPVN